MRAFSGTVQRTAEPLDSVTRPPIFMQFTGQNNGGTYSSAFLLAKKAIDWPDPA